MHPSVILENAPMPQSRVAHSSQAPLGSFILKDFGLVSYKTKDVKSIRAQDVPV